MILDGWTRAGLRLSLRFSSVNFVRVLHGRAGLAVTHLAACTRERYSNCVIHGPSRASASPRRRSSRRSRPRGQSAVCSEPNTLSLYRPYTCRAGPVGPYLAVSLNRTSRLEILRCLRMLRFREPNRQIPVRAARNGSESRDRRRGHWGSGGGATTRQQHPLRATVPRKVGLPRRSKAKGCAPCERVISTSEERARLRLTAGRTYGPCDEYIQVNLNLNL